MAWHTLTETLPTRNASIADENGFHATFVACEHAAQLTSNQLLSSNWSTHTIGEW
jgi:hypothetical protein